MAFDFVNGKASLEVVGELMGGKTFSGPMALTRAAVAPGKAGQRRKAEAALQDVVGCSFPTPNGHRPTPYSPLCIPS